MLCMIVLKKFSIERELANSLLELYKPFREPCVAIRKSAYSLSREGYVAITDGDGRVTHIESVRVLYGQPKL